MSQTSDPTTSFSTPATENNLQPFFVLHRSSSSAPKKTVTKTRRKIELSPKTPNTTEECTENLRFEAFKSHWSNTESTIRDVLKTLNANVFNRIDKWVHDSFDTIRAYRKLDFSSATRSYPVSTSVSIAADSVASRQIFTSLLFTKNIEFVDDILTFTDLGVRLRSSGCYVAKLTSLDFSAKSGVGGCLKTLLKQFLMCSVDAPDMSVLASWYAERENNENPLVVIIDDVERCCGSVLADFIIMLREWVIKVPIILVLGVATTIDALRNSLGSNACSYLSLCEFTLGTPAERIDAVIEAILLRNCESFSIGKQVSTFLRNYFLRHDGTLTLFLRALKITMVQHVYMEPLSFSLRKLVDEENTKDIDGESILLKESLPKRVLGLPSFKRFCQSTANNDDWASGLSELKRLCKLWSSTVRCLYEVGKRHKITLLDLYCEMREPEPHKSAASYNNHSLGRSQNEGYVVRALQIVRELPASELCKLLKSWEMHTRGITEVHEKVKELQTLTAFEENRPKQDLTEPTKRLSARNYRNEALQKTTNNEKVVTFLQCMVREHIQPIESIPLNEIVFFNNVDKLQTALIGDPRRRIQADLLESPKFLKCSCCSGCGVSVPSMHDTSIMYSLAQEHGDLINLHEWFHSFKAIVSHPPVQAKKRSRLSPSPKKRKASNMALNKSDASIQAQFCRAVTELQITGLLRMPTKRRPDYVQRVAFGL